MQFTLTFNSSINYLSRLRNCLLIDLLMLIARAPLVRVYLKSVGNVYTLNLLET